MYLNWNLRKSVACEQIFGGADGGTAKHIGRALDDTSFKKLSAWLRSFLPWLSATEIVLGVGGPRFQLLDHLPSIIYFEFLCPIITAM